MIRKYRIPTKRTIWQRAVAAILAALAIGGCSKSEFRSVPAASCEYHRTGKTDWEFSHYQCYSFDSKGQCTNNQPIYVQTHETEVVCAFTEYRR